MDPVHQPRSLGQLPLLWQERADFVELYGDPNGARLWRLAAAELEASLAAHGDGTLSLVEAAKASGYSAGHLGHLVKRGAIPNAGRVNAPRIRRADLPIKQPTKPGRPPQGGPVHQDRPASPGSLTSVARRKRR